jgi:hypothetical protein
MGRVCGVVKVGRMKMNKKSQQVFLFIYYFGAVDQAIIVEIVVLRILSFIQQHLMLSR